MRILLVDNDGDLIDQVINGIHQNYIVDVAHDSVQESYLSEVNDYDAVIVGPALFDSEGSKLCEMARTVNSTVPVAIIPSKNDPQKRTLALNAGADVCINYPVEAEELNAQLRALIRRNSLNLEPVITVGNVSLDCSKRKVIVGGKPVLLRKKEYELLEILFINRGRVVTKEKMLEHIWDRGIYIFSNTVEVQMRNLKLALKKKGARQIFRTVRGFGYTVEG
jgi:DNA-binding response OmpR family regulator